MEKDVKDISVIKPDMAVVGQDRLGLSPFGMLSQVFHQEVVRRSQLHLGFYQPVPLALLEEEQGEEAAAAKPAELHLQFEVNVKVEAPKEKAKGKKEAQEKPAQKEQEPVRHQFSLKGKKILLAEDNMVNMEIATEILSMNGLEIIQAWNGLEALEKFKASKPFEIDAILMDMQMPQMDGCESARSIRALPRPDAKQVPILAVTANAFAEDITATTAAGMNAHISKPIDFNILCQTLEKLIGTQSLSAP